MEMKRVKCKSGLIGWQCRLRQTYGTLEEFADYCRVYAIDHRLGFASPEEAWGCNPIIKGSIIPSDLQVVKF